MSNMTGRAAGVAEQARAAESDYICDRGAALPLPSRNPRVRELEFRRARTALFATGKAKIGGSCMLAAAGTPHHVDSTTNSIERGNCNIRTRRDVKAWVRPHVGDHGRAFPTYCDERLSCSGRVCPVVASRDYASPRLHTVEIAR